MRLKSKSLFLIMLAVIFLSISGMAPAAETADSNQTETGKNSSFFRDVADGNNNFIYINYLAKRGIMSGYPDGSFHPSEGLTRAQAATLLVKAAGLSASGGQKNVFKDVASSHWAAGNISAASSAGYLNGYPDGTYHPEEILSRAQGISLVLRLSKQKLTGVDLPILKDIDNNHWAAHSVAIGLAAGMVGLSSDKSSFLPDQEFSRGDLARALAVLLTTDPDLKEAAIKGSLSVKKGEVKVNDKVVDKNTEIKAGDIIITANGAEAQLSYSDGTGMLIKEKTTLQVKEIRGFSYIKSNGDPGVGVDWLLADLKKGQIFGALAANPNIKSDTRQEKKTAQAGLKTDLFASLNGMELAAVQVKDLPWYQNANMKKVKVKVDMPWGAATIRGSFWDNTVTDSGCSTSLLEGDAELSAGTQTQTLAPGQSSVVSQGDAAPTSPAAMGVAQVNQWVQQAGWLQTVSQDIQAQQAAVQTEAVITAPSAPALTTPQPVIPDVLNVVNQALTQVQQTAGITNIIQLNVTQPSVPPVVPPTTTTPVTNPTSGGGGGGGSGTSTTVAFNDAKLESVVRNALSKPAGTITKSDMESLQLLDAGGCGIADLTGLQYASNLTVLHLEYNNITNISQLANLNKLQEIYLGNNHISDISTANWAGMTGLSKLYLISNPLQDISPLANATSLKDLRLSETQISNINCLSGLINLTMLDIGDTQVTDLSVLSSFNNLTGLSVYGDYGMNSEANISIIAAKTGLLGLNIGKTGINSNMLATILAGMSNLQNLWAGGNNITDITPLHTKTGLTDLDLQDNHISSISALSGLANLESLNFNNNQVEDIAVLGGLSRLKNLHMGSNLITDLSVLSNHPGLITLSIFDNKVGSSISVIQNMPDIEELYMANTGASNLTGLLANMSKLRVLRAGANGIGNDQLSFLAGFPELKSLWLPYNNISDISVLANMTGLEELDLGSNHISSIAPLANLHELKNLSIEYNLIQDISPVAGLAGLESFQAGGNQITDISALALLSNSLKSLSLFDNRVGGSISALANMTNMERLYISNMGLTDLAPLVANMDKLEILHAQCNQISEISCLQDKSNLQELQLQENNIGSISALGSIPRLNSLNINDNRVSNIDVVAGLTHMRNLHVGNNGITDISALANLNHMRTLSLYGNNVGASINVIKNMADLRELYIDDMGLTDISDLLANMKQLTVLSAGGNQISDLSVLANKNGLKELHLDHNNITNLSDLSGLANLTALSVEHNSIKDISPVANLINLEGLNFGDNHVSRMLDLANLDKMKTLAMFSNPIAGVDNAINVIAGMVNMEELYIDDLGEPGAKLSSLLAISGMNNLKVLYASGNQLDDNEVNLLGDMSGLEELNLDSTLITSISFVSKLINLKFLSFKDNNVADIAVVATLGNLEGLDFGGTLVNDITPIANLDGLKFLSLWEVPVSDISVIADKIKMEDLCIHKTGITDLSTLLANMRNLKALKARDNGISDISALAGKTDLQLLELQNNKISDVSALVTNCQNGGLGKGDKVYLSDNNLDSDDTGNIQTLINAGVEGDLDTLL